MSSFDFTALLKFLGSLFDAFVNLFAKLGFDLGLGKDDENAEAGEEAGAEA